MGILIDFAKTAEDDERVEYGFGTRGHRLVIDRATGTASPVEGPADRDFHAVAWKITRLYRERGTWPARGMYAA